ncbi:hypothetical protein CAEBREN_18583 [Caenorhabditis brenneri]|uniref:RING-type domain-containing protein n=1 Tax=Caenorhabditis brenneri TaxID=135651 RepID=G0NUX5_CAEBE|nr:hypothetical protein CAEBREN_18583 [Caenorhabditis brenneri]
MSESAEAISNADTNANSSDAANAKLPDVEFGDRLEESSKTEKTAGDIIRETADNVQSCRVCYDEYHTSRNQARVLGCGHTFCTRCVISCSTPKGQSVPQTGIKCPECRKISEQAPATVPVNFQLMQILAALSLVKEPQSLEQDLDVLQYENFDRLGAHIPTNELATLSQFEFEEHLKAVFNAIRVSWRRDRSNVNQSSQARYEIELRKLDDLEAKLQRHFKTLESLKANRPDNEAYDPFQWYMAGRENRRSNHDIDWMREMVVYRPPGNSPVLRDPSTPNSGPGENQNPELSLAQDVDAVLEREEAARAEADPLRNLNLMRETILRRERENAQERELAIRNERLMRQLINEEDATFYERLQMLGLPHLTPLEREQRDRRNREIELQRRALALNRQRESNRRVANGLPPILDYDDITLEEVDNHSEASDDSSVVEVVVLPRPPEPKMTIGEAITIYRLVEVFSPRSLRIDADSFVLPNNHPNLDSLYRELLPLNATILNDLREPHLVDIRRYCQSNNIDCDRLLRSLRQHTVRFAPTLVETPRLTERRRRNRPILSDNYNAQLTVIRTRAKEALEGKRPERPIDDDEAELTVRLIVNLATSMGVRNKLDDIICPQHRAQNEEKDMFIQRTNSSTRQEMLFCTACRCEVPVGSKQVHTKGKRHVANIANRSQSRRQQ